MNTQGIITRIENDIIILQQSSDEECGSCNASKTGHEVKGCTSCSLMASSKKHYLKAVNTKRLNLNIGDRISIYLPPSKAILGALNIFIIPIAAFFVFFMIFAILFPSFGDMEKAIAGICGLAVWYGIFFIINKIRQKKDWPIVHKKIDDGTN